MPVVYIRQARGSDRITVPIPGGLPRGAAPGLVRVAVKWGLACPNPAAIQALGRPCVNLAALHRHEPSSSGNPPLGAARELRPRDLRAA